MLLRDKIIKDLKTPESLIDEALSYAQRRVKIFKIEKKSGGTRLISQPSNKLKIIQYWLINNLFKKIEIHESAIAYREGLSIYDNAKRHVKNNYFLKVDLKDFFPSIKQADLLAILKEWIKANPQEWDFNLKAKRIIKLSCFDRSGSLPIGYPTSPIISNIVMMQFDQK